MFERVLPLMFDKEGVMKVRAGSNMDIFLTAHDRNKNQNVFAAKQILLKRKYKPSRLTYATTNSRSNRSQTRN